MQLLEGELKVVADLAHKLCGLVLDETKDYLIECRLAALVTESGCLSYAELCGVIEANPFSRSAQQFVDRISTGETRFFRDGHPYDALQHKVYPEAFDALTCATNKVRILSAACSTGQEPVGLAMLAVEMFGTLATTSFEIIGTDISTTALDKAKSGLYSDFDVRRSERPALTSKWMKRADGQWQVDPRVANLLRYEQSNITTGLAGLGSFDVVFCRNVAIYFDRPTREKIFDSIYASLNPGGLLVVGSYEEPPCGEAKFSLEEHCRSILYRKS